MCQYDSEHVDSPKGDHVHALKLCYVIIVVLRTHTHNQSQSSDSNKKGVCGVGVKIYPPHTPKAVVIIQLADIPYPFDNEHACLMIYMNPITATF